MKWTATIKGITTFFLVIMIIGACIAGFAVMNESGALGFGIICGGILISIISVGLVMVLCEISENIYYIRSNIERNAASITNSTELKRQRETVADGSWVCNCGARNKAESRFCRSCGKENTSSPVNRPSVSVWRCPECGKTNPNSSRVCKDCGYNK